MKKRTTKKAINNNYKNVICVGYCNLQTLLSGHDAKFYTVRAEGWAADVYEISANTAIVTGYAPFGNIKPEYDLQREYEVAAEAACADVSISYEMRREKIEKLLSDFIEVFTK